MLSSLSKTSLFRDLPKKARIFEVGPRDGLQNEPLWIETAHKVQFIRDLVEAGIQEIEASSFVSPRWVPQMKDAEQVATALSQDKRSLSKAKFSFLVPNEKGLDRALMAGASGIGIFLAASETFSQKNTNCSIEESIQRLDPVVKKAKREGLWLRGYISMVFHCPYEGDIVPSKVKPLVDQMLEWDIDEISCGDTIGKAHPLEVEALLEALLPTTPKNLLAMHFHDTYGTALANVLTSLQYGLSIFDSSAGGLGGCPYAPGAKGNLATEQLLALLHGFGIDTGIDSEKVIKAARKIREKATPLEK
jgi:hydroxymethylglutaryl-CoA lyase